MNLFKQNNYSKMCVLVYFLAANVYASSAAFVWK